MTHNFLGLLWHHKRHGANSKSGIHVSIHREDLGDSSPRFRSGDVYTNFPTTFGPMCNGSFLFPLVSSKFFSLDTLARLHFDSVKFLFQKLEIWVCNVTSKFNSFFFIFGFVIVDTSYLPRCTKTHVKLHKISYEMYKNCLRLGIPKLASRLKMGSNALRMRYRLGLCPGLAGGLYSVPPCPLCLRELLRAEKKRIGNEKGTEGWSLGGSQLENPEYAPDNSNLMLHKTLLIFC